MSNRHLRLPAVLATALMFMVLLPGCADSATTVIPGTGDPGTGTGLTDTGSGTTDPCVQDAAPASATQLAMLDALNQYRASRGLAALANSRILEQAATAHAVDMYNRGFFDHINPDGDGPLERAVGAGFCRMRTIGENIAWNQASVADVQLAWQNSPGHNANMISTEFRYVGMGYYDSPAGPYYVQVFGDVFPE
jgi:uncharacterized protein YkwD